MVLVVVAILLMASLAVEGLMTQSRVRAFSQDATSLAGAIQMYRARYGALPGDDPHAGARWPGVASGNGNGTVGGRYDLAPPADTAALANGAEENESLLAWLHLRRAGYLVGATEGSAAASGPIGVTGSPYGMQSGAFGLSSVVACFAGAAGALAEGIDRNLDDGSPHSGTVRAGPTLAQAADGYAHDARYALCISLDGSTGPSALAPVAAAPPSAAASGTGDTGTGSGTSSGTGTTEGGSAAGGSTDTTSGGTTTSGTTSGDSGGASGGDSWWGGWSGWGSWGGWGGWGGWR